MLTNPRAMRVARQSDNLWSRLLEIPTALSGRTYETDGSLVLRIADDAMCPKNVGNWQLDVRGRKASRTPTDQAADVTPTIPALSSLFFGGVSAHNLAYGGRIEPHNSAALDIMDRMFQIDPEPHNSFGV